MLGKTAVVSLAALLLLSAGCTADKKPTTPDTANSRPPAADTPVETRTFYAGPDKVTMTMMPLARTGDTVVLTAQTRVDEILAGHVGSMITSRFAYGIGLEFSGGRLIDESAGRAYNVARSPNRDCTCTHLLYVDAGQTAPLQAAFTGIPAGVTKLTVMLPNAGVFTDVPVVTAAAPVPTASAKNGLVPPLVLDTSNTSESGTLTAYIDQLNVPVSTTRTHDQVDIALSADVLFRIDSAEVTPAAAKSIAAAVADLRRAGPGPLTVTGHTDDTGTAAHNQTLSLARARAVADALDATLPSAQWPRTVAGKGETQPVAPNDSATGRRLNRRVTISYQPRTAAPGPAPSVTATATAMPATKGVQ